jgi:hypothetical protein
MSASDNARQRRWITRRRQAWLAANGPCAKCGSWENLEIDHIDPAQKTADVSLIWSRAESYRLAELAKCQVLCKPCHREKSIAEGSLRPLTHGTRKRYEDGGCRCDLCRAANAARGRAKRANGEARRREADEKRSQEMSLHRTPEQHDADPPEKWRVVKLDTRSYNLVTSLGEGAVLGHYRTKREAEAAKVDSPWVRLYEREGRWFRGEPVNGWKPYRPAA